MNTTKLSDLIAQNAGLATYAGFQEGIPSIGLAGFNLWNLEIDIPGHPAGSTVSDKTISSFLEWSPRF